MFENTVKLLGMQEAMPNVQITKDEFFTWNKNYLFDRLRGIDYARSFMSKFNVRDYILEFTKDEDRCRSYIIKTYVRG